MYASIEITIQMRCHHYNPNDDLWNSREGELNFFLQNCFHNPILNCEGWISEGRRRETVQTLNWITISKKKMPAKNN